MKIKRDEKLLQRCCDLWLSLSPLRDERNRNIRYKNGYHWSEIVSDPQNSGSMVREEDLLTREGRIALKYNFINQFVRNILGQVIKNPSQSVIQTRSRGDQPLGEMLTNTLQSSLDYNRSSLIDIEICEELLMTGIACTKVRYDYNSLVDSSNAVLEPVAFDTIFFNDDLGDCRMNNLRIIGQLHDMTIDEIVLNFASSPSQESKLRRVFRDSVAEPSTQSNIHNSTERSKNFYRSTVEDYVRVIEVWQREGRWVERVHDQESGMLYTSIPSGSAPSDTQYYQYYWRVTFMTADGTILSQRETPYKHKEHPYVFATLPFTNGEVKSLISDLIDIQRYINRLIVMIDHIIESSAKGVLMVPESSIPDGLSIEDFTKEYVKTNGVIVYRPSPTRDVPYQITANSTNVGAWEMLSLQMNLIQQISGLSGAIQGHSSSVSMAASLYSQQTANSQLNYQVLFEALRQYREHRDDKLLKVLIQYYSEPRVITSSGAGSSQSFAMYDPKQVENLLDYKIVISQSVDTPLYRQLYEDILMSMLQSKHIDIELFLQNSSLPFSDRLLSQIQSRQQGEQT